jgi:hypothetical protein
MDNYESTRRGFLRKLGLSVGAAVSVTGVKGIEIMEKHLDFPLSEAQQQFIIKYESWMDNFVKIINLRKGDPDNLEYNLQLMRLSEEHEQWQGEVKTYIEDQNFAKHYMIITQRITNQID